MIYIVQFLALIMAITIHEFMHAWTSNYLGDLTPKRAGRLTLNPLSHIDLFGTLLLPILLMLAGIPPIGWAKPVPINPNNYNNPRLGSALTSIAGPMSNFLQASFAALVINFVPVLNPYIKIFLMAVIVVNLFLMVFNLLPIPPLDGSKFFAYFFPILENPKFELYGPIILLIFIYFFRGGSYLLPIVNFIATKVLNVAVF